MSVLGDRAPDFTLKGLDDQRVRLREMTGKGKVVLMAPRGASETGFAEAKA